ncbi:hypothetical protein [Celeribacter baekdonensis]|uniref:Uncharacterized protein n=1 Tax=Celeribacter baekdonensis TaxID=875171 RepID=A0A2R4M403_9RHOB|nr:hypothetical protein [Celeribacter baekdonensis]AVW91911.1 hypothetical protein DA792_13180 [Celeribacter baekdonensis]
MRFILPAVFLLSFPQMAMSDVVCNQLEDPLPLLEEIKTSFASGHFEVLKQLAKVVSPSESESTDLLNVIAALQEAFPEGFAACSTLMSDHISERFISEMVAFQASDGHFIFLGLDAVNVEFGWEVVRYHLSDNFEGIRREWK